MGGEDHYAEGRDMLESFHKEELQPLASWTKKGKFPKEKSKVPQGKRVATLSAGAQEEQFGGVTTKAEEASQTTRPWSQ